MESLDETDWDVVISGTGLQQSLLALALSRSQKKVLHVDENEYYGGPEAAFSLQEAEEWALKTSADDPHAQFSAASISKAYADTGSPAVPNELSFSRAYTLTLSPQIIYSRSRFLPLLVSSKVYRQLEFQAVGNWWLYTSENISTASEEGSPSGTLKRIPNGREDVFSDRSIDVRAKRGLMKFLKFVADYENQVDIWQPHSGAPLPDFLSSQFRLPASLQSAILALTLSLDLPTRTTVGYALPRIARHLTSIGVFGPGFGAVMPKWGGGSEIAQVACRAGAVGGGVYVLGTGIENQEPPFTATTIDLKLTTVNTANPIRAKSLVTSGDWGRGASQSIKLAISKTIAIVSSDFTALFISTVEGGPVAAVSVVVFPSNSLAVNGMLQAYPVYIMVHSSETGECPPGQCVLYASTYGEENPKPRLEAAISTLISSYASIGSSLEPGPESAESKTGESLKAESLKVIYSLSYNQRSQTDQCPITGKWSSMPSSSLDLAFDDVMLENVEDVWRTVMGYPPKAQDGDQAGAGFMVFDDREQIGSADEDDE